MPGESETVRWRRVEALFHEASALPSLERADYLRRQPDVDEALIADVLALLQSDSEVADLIESPPNDGNGLLEDSRDSGSSEDLWIGRTVGTFHISALLGQGGMGRVYRATRRRGGFEGTVAIKLIGQLLASPAAQGRFLNEREALAQLHHPHIASLIDGGLTEEGLPYLAMEYVAGRRIDQVADDPATTLSTVCRLALQLCDAVSYVHRHLLLHRDLKPGNILVTDEGELKLLDFGAFKSFGSERGEPAVTQFGMRVLTWRYASPEHIVGDAMSTASDIFSLGMTLYRVLLGHLPPEFATLNTDSYLNALRDDRLAPVHRLLVARWKISTTLARDLEAILRKALRFSPEGRYPDADALAADLARALEGRAITAVPATGRSLALRFLGRHRTAVSLACLLVFLLTVAVAAMARQVRVVRAEERRAERGLEKESGLNHFLLVDYFEELKRVPGSTAAQKGAVSQALAYADRLASLGDRADLDLDRVQAYTEMGSLLGNPYESNLDNAPEGIRTLGKAVLLSEKLTSTAPANLEFEQAQAAAELALGRTYFGSGDPQQAVKYLLPAAQTSQRIAASGHVDAAILAQAASVLDALADVYELEGAITLNNRPEALRWARRAQEVDAQGLALDPSCVRCRRGVAIQDWKIGLRTDDPKTVAGLAEAGLTTLSALPPREQETPRVRRTDTMLRQQLGMTYLQLGRTAEGLQVLGEVRHRFQKAAALDAIDARAQFDLFALDSNIVEPLGPHQAQPIKLEVGREMLATTETLVRLDRDNPQWLIHRSAAQDLLGEAEREDGNIQGADALEDEAAKTLVVLAEKPKATPEVLDDAAHALVLTRKSGAMAHQFAARAVAQSSPPTADQYLTLAEGQLLDGDRGGATVSAQRGLEALKSKPESVKRTRMEARARHVLEAVSVSPAR